MCGYGSCLKCWSDMYPETVHMTRFYTVDTMLMIGFREAKLLFLRIRQT